ncbi:MAG: DUF2283 domain-containing protein [Pirellulaceae bacterium]
MKERYLEVTYYKGRLLAAYLYLPRKEGDRSVRVDEFARGIVVDLTEDGRPIGVELTSPGEVTLQQVNAALEKYGIQALLEDEFSPLHQAA